ncbi:hypothetical protein [Ornithinimicrobium kibberense]|uniref:hypothetical protein n=1 Tax=Ornithinimicrobium kibberense TaxID=282060 RepID=UPI00361AAC0C
MPAPTRQPWRRSARATVTAARSRTCARTSTAPGEGDMPPNLTTGRATILPIRPGVAAARTALRKG